MDKASQTRLAKVHPELAARVANTIAALAARGIDARVVQGIRTYDEQDRLFRQGRSTNGQVVTNARGGFSNHNFGLAVDLCPFVGGEPKWDRNDLFQIIGHEAVAHGLAWGGNWRKFIDKPHVELPTGLTTAQCRSMRGSGDLTKLWARASQILGSAADASPVGDPSSGVLPKNSKPDTQVHPSEPAAQPSILKRGDKGPAVRKVQQALIAAGYKIKADGDYGQKTYEAVVRFQRAKDLYVDGRVGPETRKALGL